MRLEARATRRPGDKGTKRLLDRYGARLLFVRYRYDPQSQRMLTTVELIVSQRPVRRRRLPPADTSPSPSEPVHTTPSVATTRSEHVGLRVAAREHWLRDKVRAAGGHWDPRRALWILPAAQAARLRLPSRLIALPPRGTTGSNRSTLEYIL